jgi:D-alanyl-D-alanine carboxypeptidase
LSVSRRVRGILVALTLALPLSATPAGAPTVAASDNPPRCRYGDVLATARRYDEWSHTLLDTTFRLPRSYAPRDLRSTGVAGGGLVRSFVLRDLRAMFRDASRAGAALMIRSAYRSYRTQISTFAYWVRVEGRKRALLSSARPGHSEHQLGTAIDVTSRGGLAPWDYQDWGATRAGTWMRRHAWQYGFVLSYPKGASPGRTCYKYEPWHFRYVGKETARAIRESGQTPREWFWQNPDGLDGWHYLEG